MLICRCLNSSQLVEHWASSRKVIPRSLWRTLESKNVTVNDMSAKYQSLVNNLEQWSSDASSLLDGSARLFPDASVKIDNISDSLFTPRMNDPMVLELLQLLASVFHTFTKRLLADHLEGDLFASPDPEVALQAKSVPQTNRVNENDFAQLDFHMREKPNATLVALEGIILFVNNSVWLLLWRLVLS